MSHIVAVQVHVSLLFADGKAAGMATPYTPVNLPENALSSDEGIVEQIVSCAAAIGQQLHQSGQAAIYEQAAQEAEARRTAVRQRAAAAREFHTRQGVRHDIGRPRPVGKLPIEPRCPADPIAPEAPRQDAGETLTRSDRCEVYPDSNPKQV